jgi:hypothetical protein
MKAYRSACNSEIALHRGINILDRRALLAILRPSIAPVLLKAAFADLGASVIVRPQQGRPSSPVK